MKTEVKEISVGAVVFTVFLGVMIFVYSGQNDNAEAASGIRVSASFNRIDGLVDGDPVYLSGVKIGSVDKMWLNENYRAVVSFWVNDKYVIPSDSSAAIHTDGLFGSKYIVIEPGAEEKPLKNGSTITLTQDAVVVSELLDLIISEGKANRAKQVKQ
ncbi:MAG: MlaD family protein [Rhodospirillales bacterium]|jgi:phospholipid/cholesterol/gamma-HCH transport system substrate-binding protein|nr:MlaD family protein [Rhodospirillales bacterium]